jgi:hypothetical protein
MITSFIIRDIEGRGRTLEPTKTQLPAAIAEAEIMTSDVHSSLVVPALIADIGDDASWRYVEFFTANIATRTRAGPVPGASSRFFAWCEQRGLSLTTIRPFDVATYIESLRQEHSAPGVKQQLGIAEKIGCHTFRATGIMGKPLATPGQFDQAVFATGEGSHRPSDLPVRNHCAACLRAADGRVDAADRPAGSHGPADRRDSARPFGFGCTGRSFNIPCFRRAPTRRR